MNKLEDFEVNGEEEQNANDKTGEVVEMKMCLSMTLPVVKNQCRLQFKYLPKPFLPLLAESGQWRRRTMARSITVQIYYRPVSHNEEQ